MSRTRRMHCQVANGPGQLVNVMAAASKNRVNFEGER